jgi:protein-disulfide isomerase
MSSKTTKTEKTTKSATKSATKKVENENVETTPEVKSKKQEVKEKKEGVKNSSSSNENTESKDKNTESKELKVTNLTNQEKSEKTAKKTTHHTHHTNHTKKHDSTQASNSFLKNLSIIGFASVALVLIFLISFQVYTFQLIQENKDLLTQEKNKSLVMESNLSSLQNELQPVLDAIRAQQTQENPTSVENIKAPNPANEYFRGNPKANIVLIEYSDYSCPFCRKVLPTLKSLVQENPDVAWVYRDYPIIHPESKKHAEAAYCAGKQGGSDVYWKFVDAMLAEGFGFSQQEFESIAQTSKLNVNEFKKCYESGEMQQKVEQVVSESQQSLSAYRVGTPTIVVYNRTTNQNKLVVGALPKAEFEKAIQEIR